MKKLISGITALAIFSALTMGVCADTTIEPTGGTPFDITPDPESANATVEFNTDPKYTVTIPAKFELTGSYGTTYTGSGAITTSEVFLNEGDKIVVTLTSASNFKMSHEGTGGYKLPYTASTAAFGAVDKETGGKVAEFPTSKTAASAEVTFTTDETPQFAGKYSDPVVFGISVEKEAT